jgi:glutamate formiminotransferase/formiminotetrahydrofolate cyclodeaminase
LIDAGIHFLKKQQRSIGISEKEIMKIAVKSLGLDELSPFTLEERVIEYMLEDTSKQLVDMNLVDFANETSSESPAPGGGSISAYCGAMGAALGTMVANLSAHKRGWDERWEEFSDWAEKGIAYQNELLRLVDEDTNAFNKIMEAFRLPKDSDEEKALRQKAIQDATKFAILTPFKVMETAYDSMQVMKAMAEIGNPNSVTDAAVGALCARTAVRGAFLNVKINCGDCEDQQFVSDILEKGQALVDKATELENDIMKVTEGKI